MNEGAAALLPAGMRMLERGWLSSNSLLLSGDPRGAVIVDTGYFTHREQTLSLVRAALGPDQALRLIVNTHLHSDHCGGNAHLAAAFDDCPIWIPPGHFEAARSWSDEVLSYLQTGQQCERFTPDRALLPGESFEQAGRQWQAHAAPGHDPHSLILFEPESGLLMSADALWEQGFGIVFPEIESGTGRGFDEVAATLDLIGSLPVRLVVPGHGSAFTDVGRALAVARERLDFFRKNPVRHARHAAKALIKYHLLEVAQEPRADLLQWLANTPIHRQMWQGFFSDQPIEAWTLDLLDDLARTGALSLRDGVIHNA